jgi:hypothetical protein
MAPPEPRAGGAGGAELDERRRLGGSKDKGCEEDDGREVEDAAGSRAPPIARKL